MPNDDKYQTSTSDTHRHNSTRRIVEKGGWQCSVCGHANLSETAYCSKCGYRLGAQRYFR